MKLFLLFLLYATALSVALRWRGIRSGAGREHSTPEERPTRVLIVGATGGTGRQLVEQALERGYVVTALARDPSALRVEHPRLTVVRGNVLDYPSVDAAVRGQDAVLSALGHNSSFVQLVFCRREHGTCCTPWRLTASGDSSVRRPSASGTVPDAWVSFTPSS